MKLACPMCGQITVYGPNNPVRPFCSARCKERDAANWADDQYVLSEAANEMSLRTVNEQDEWEIPGEGKP